MAGLWPRRLKYPTQLGPIPFAGFEGLRPMTKMLTESRSKLSDAEIALEVYPPPLCRSRGQVLHISFRD